MNKLQARLLKLPFPGIENAYVLVSFGERPDDRIDGSPLVTTNLSFLYDGGETATEWEPEHGPIQVWHKAEAGKEHYFYDFVEDRWGNWSQLAVYENDLPAALLRQDYAWIFSVLRRWTE